MTALVQLLRGSDQLSREAERGEIFHGFCEGPLSFRPTYKYDIGTDDYDTSAKVFSLYIFDCMKDIIRVTA